jgi:peptidyl-dipeptidase A
LFEILAYDHPALDLHSLYSEIHEHYLGFPRHPEHLWAANILFLTHPLHLPNIIMGRLIAAQLMEALRERWGRDLDRPEVGDFIREQCWRPGASRPWEDIVHWVTGRRLDPDAFLRTLGIPD